MVELLMAYEDKTWDTEVFDVPANVVGAENDDQVVTWWRKVHGGLSCYRKVVQVAVYSYMPEEGK